MAAYGLARSTAAYGGLRQRLRGLTMEVQQGVICDLSNGNNAYVLEVNHTVET